MVMSLTLDDVDQLSTDSDDEEYIPEGGGSCESSTSEGELEDIAESRRRNSRTQNLGAKQRKIKKRAPPRKRKRGLHLEGGEDDEGEEDEREEVDCEGEDEREGEEDVVANESAKKHELEEKSRIDDLWASFKQDTTSLHPKSKGKDSVIEATPPKKLKIQKVYDFAGEEILVEKDVPADSKEAKKYLLSQTKSENVTPETSEVDQQPLPQLDPKPHLQGSCPQDKMTKRSSGLTSVLKSLGKKSKMSTLEKSNLDWMKYKQEEGLEEELTQNSKDGYLAKQEFLQRADQRQFEQERDERLKRFKRLK